MNSFLHFLRALDIGDFAKISPPYLIIAENNLSSHFPEFLHPLLSFGEKARTFKSAEVRLYCRIDTAGLILL